MPELVKPDPVFADIYRQASALAPTSAPAVEAGKRVTFSAVGMPLEMFLRYVSDKCGISVVAEKSLDTAQVTVEVVDQDVSDVLGMVARRLGVQVTRSGSLYFLGGLRPEDRGVLVRKVTRLSSVGLKSAITTLMSSNGRVECYEDGLVVVGDGVEVLQRVNRLLDEIEAAPINSWVVQLYLVSMSRKAAAELGFDVTPGVVVSASLARGSDGTSLGKVDITGALSAVLRATAERTGVEMVAQPLFLVVDGAECSFVSGQAVPVPRKAVSDAGTVSTVGYETIQTGLQVKIAVRESGGSGARLTVRVSLSGIAGYVEAAPVVDTQSFDTVAAVQAAGVYLLGWLERRDETDRDKGVLPLLFGRDKSRGAVQVWARCFRVGGLLK